MKEETIGEQREKSATERMVGGGNNSFAKTICSICYEDLKPIVEDLQSISICGHVFHELCIQQWFEYCTNSKKKNCPVCKQTCSEKNVSRLYFQSVGDPNELGLSQKRGNCEENPEELCGEIRRLEGKVCGLSSALEQQQKDFKEVNEELCLCKEQVKKETTFKVDAMQQKAAMERLLHLKSEELNKSTLECMRLQDRSMALAKELAALKLVSDLNLVEEDVLKLASLGKEANSKETIDILKKSLVIRNKSYKELMAKCNALGRGDARSLIKLEKAKEKIKKLKTRVQELETAVESKDNEVLRALKGSKKTTCEINISKDNSKPSFMNKCSLKDQTKGPAAPHIHLDKQGIGSRGLSCSGKTEEFKPLNNMNTCKRNDNNSTFEESGSYVLLDGDKPEISPLMHEFLHQESATQATEAATIQKSCFARQGEDYDAKRKAQMNRSSKKGGISNSVSYNKDDMTTTPTAGMDDDVVLLTDDRTHDQHLLNIKKDTSSLLPESQPGDHCFSGGLLGPDGSKWHLGKWCKQRQIKGSAVLPRMQGSSPSTGDLIAVGADGRGGRIKVLRSLSQSSLEVKENSPLAKRCKLGAKTSTLQSQGCLQIEHFFARAG